MPRLGDLFVEAFQLLANVDHPRQWQVDLYGVSQQAY